MINPALNNVRMTNIAKLKSLGFINDNLEELGVDNFIKLTQDKYIENVLGTNLYQVFLNQILSNTFEDRIKILLDNYIVPSIGWMVKAELMQEYSFKLRNAGLVQTPDSNLQPQDFKNISILSQKYRDNGQFYLDNMVRYMLQYSGSYPEFHNNDSFDKQSNDDTFTCSLYLGKPRGVENDGRHASGKKI